MFRWTSNWRNIYLYPGENRWRSKIIENSKIGMSRHLDSSTTTQMTKIVVQCGRPSSSSWAKLVRSSFGRTIMGKAIWENPIAALLGKVPNKECLFLLRQKNVILICVCEWHKICWKETNHWSDVKVKNKEDDLGETTSSLDHQNLGCTQRQCEISKDIVDNYRTMFDSRISAERTEKLQYSEKLVVVPSDPMTWRVMPRNVWNDIVSWQTRRLNNSAKLSTPCIDDHHFIEEELKSVGELSTVSSQIVLKYLYLTRIGRPDFLWSVNNFARSITKWTKTCDKRLSRLISYIHHTGEYKQHCHVGNTAKQCRLGLFQDSDFAGDLENSKSIYIRWNIVHFWTSYVCSNQLDVSEISVSHNSTESESISLDAGLRDDFTAFDLWNLIDEVLGNTNQNNGARRDLCANQREVRSTRHTIQKRNQSHSLNDQWFGQWTIFPQTCALLTKKLCLLYVY